MKKIIALSLSLVFLFSFCVNSIAFPLSSADNEDVEDVEYPLTTNNDYLDILLNILQNDITSVGNDVVALTERVDVLDETVSSFSSSDELNSSVDDSSIIVDPSTADSILTDVSVYSVSPISPNDTTGLKSVLLSLIGDYDAIVVEYEYTSNNNYVSYLREVQPDYVWLCSAAIFLVIIYSVFRLGGILLNG